MKKLILTLISLLALMSFSGCKKSPVYVTRAELTSTDLENSFEVDPPFFKVTDESTGAVVYMLGSMHVGKPEAVYPEKVVSALDECGTLAVEIDLIAFDDDLAAAADAIQIMMCSSGMTVKDYMGGDYDRIVRKFKDKGLYDPIYEQYIPSLWSSLWSNEMARESGYASSCGTDRLLLSYAKGQGKKIYEIETAAEQYRVQANTSAQLQMLTLTQTVELTDEEMEDQLNTLYNAWKSADMETLKALASEEEDGMGLSEELAADYARYYDEMYTNRQKKMADYVMNELQTGGKTFVMVGAMHYAAPPSILDILTENGYTIEALN